MKQRIRNKIKRQRISRRKHGNKFIVSDDDVNKQKLELSNTKKLDDKSKESSSLQEKINKINNVTVWQRITKKWE
ncbi:hypothetical protein [Lactobacillus gasseri]|jgi:hypothetical protein|uniref:hypothetical protein n=1 Tax=Lactobacillus gasseri TaxID=1596 RepID=UPI000665F720|nr:hypothetical protein [Lactobacillus gasseri]WEA89468.1 hypothetical protein PUW43_10055 [Lactobacillus gasseri]